MNINSPIRELLLLIKQCLNYSYDLQFFQKAQEVNIYEIKSRRLHSQKVVGTEKVDI